MECSLARLDGLALPIFLFPPWAGGRLGMVRIESSRGSVGRLVGRSGSVACLVPWAGHLAAGFPSYSILVVLRMHYVSDAWRRTLHAMYYMSPAVIEDQAELAVYLPMVSREGRVDVLLCVSGLSYWILVRHLRWFPTSLAFANKQRSCVCRC